MFQATNPHNSQTILGTATITTQQQQQSLTSASTSSSLSQQATSITSLPTNYLPLTHHPPATVQYSGNNNFNPHDYSKPLSHSIDLIDDASEYQNDELLYDNEDGHDMTEYQEGVEEEDGEYCEEQLAADEEQIKQNFENSLNECENDAMSERSDTSGGRLEAQYYEQENGQFLVEELPKEIVEYTENDDGELTMTEQTIQNPPSVVLFDDIVMDNDGDDAIDNNIVKKSEERAVKSASCVKVLSDVTLTPDMITKGIENIIINAKTGDKVKFENPIDVEYPQRPKSVIQPPMLSPKHSSNAKMPKSPEPCCSKSVINVDRSPDKSPSSSTSAVSTLTPVSLAPITIDLTTSIDTVTTSIPTPTSSAMTVIKMIPNEYFSKPSPNFKMPAVNTMRQQNRFPLGRTPKKLVVKLKKPLEIVEESAIEHVKTHVEIKQEREATTTSQITSVECCEILDDSPQKLNDLRSYSSSNMITIEDERKPIFEEHVYTIEEILEKESSDNESVPASPEPSSSQSQSLPKKRIKLRKKRKIKKTNSKLTRAKFLRERNLFKKKFVEKIKLEANDNAIPIPDDELSSLHLSDNTPSCSKIMYDSDSDEIEKKFKPNLHTENETTSNENLPTSPSLHDDNSNDFLIDRKIKVEESWTQHLTSAIETIESHSDDIQSDIKPQTMTTQQTQVSNLENFSSVIATVATENATTIIKQNPETDLWSASGHSFTITEDEHVPSMTIPLGIQSSQYHNHEHDLTVAGPSRALDEYRVSNFFCESDFIFPPNDTKITPTVANTSRKFIEFNEDGHTGGGWRNAFSPQYVNFDGERNSYMDLDACKANSSSHMDMGSVSGGIAGTSSSVSCIRAPSTEMLNIRTDEKMPARGEISEQESNGEIDVPWNNNQVRFKKKIILCFFFELLIPKFNIFCQMVGFLPIKQIVTLKSKISFSQKCKKINK